MKTWDIIVIGGGIIGLSLAWELRKRNASVLVVERREPGLEASHAAAGMLADCGPEIPSALEPLALASARLYPEFVRELEGESGVQVDLRSEGTIVLAESAEEFSRCSKVTLTKDGLAELEPGLAQDGRHALLLPERSVDPRALTTAALKASKHRGVEVSSGNEVISVDFSHGRTVGITTARTTFLSQVVVNCAGAWSGQLAPRPFPLRPVKGQMLSLAMPARNLLRHVVRSREIYLVPRSDGRVLIGATLEDAGFDKRTDPTTIHRMHQAALKLLPALAKGRILEDWAGLRPATPDGLPILGSTRTTGYFIATGHFRDGILLSPVTAQIMGQVVSGENPAYDISAFSPERFPLTSKT